MECMICQSCGPCSRVIEHCSPLGGICGPHSVCSSCADGLAQDFSSHLGACGQFPCPICKRFLGSRRRALQVDIDESRVAKRLRLTSTNGPVCSDSPYSVLCIPCTASDEEVRRAYRKRALSAHPDVGGTREAFEALTKAYEAVLHLRARSMQQHPRDSTEPDIPGWGSVEPRDLSRAAVVRAALTDIHPRSWPARLRDTSTSNLRALQALLARPPLPGDDEAQRSAHSAASKVSIRGLATQGSKHYARISWRNLVVESSPTDSLTVAIDSLAEALRLKLAAERKLQEGLSFEEAALCFAESEAVLKFQVDTRLGGRHLTTPWSLDLATTLAYRQEVLSAIGLGIGGACLDRLKGIRAKQQTALHFIRSTNTNADPALQKAVVAELSVRNHTRPPAGAQVQRRRLVGKQPPPLLRASADVKPARRRLVGKQPPPSAHVAAGELELRVPRRRLVGKQPPLSQTLCLSIAVLAEATSRCQPSDGQAVIAGEPSKQDARGEAKGLSASMPWFWRAVASLRMTRQEGERLLRGVRSLRRQ